MAIPLIFKRIAIIIPFLTQDKDGPVLKTKKEDDYFLVTLLGKMKNLKALLDDVFPDVGFAIGERKLEGVGADVG